MAFNRRRFEKDIKSFAKRVDEDFSSVFKNLAFRALTEVVKTTPVDTGRARANWNIGVNQPNIEVKEYKDLSLGQASAAAINKGRSLSKEELTPKDVVYITNNVEYIDILENGDGNRPPNNMVKGALQVIRTAIKSGGITGKE